MPDEQATSKAKTPQQIETELADEIKLCLARIKAVTNEEREAAKERLAAALGAFNAFVLYNQTPND
jgi:hypothetical protein